MIIFKVKAPPRTLLYKSTLKNTFSLLVAFIALISIGLQFYITDFGAISFFSFFTTLSNLLIAICLFSVVLIPNTLLGRYFSQLSVQTAITLYIFIVGLVYNLVLRGIWPLEGLAFVLDNMVHVVVPFLFVIYWSFFTNVVERLKWLDTLKWLIFPTIYLAYTLLRGQYISWYPYPFLNAQKLGYPKVFMNIGMMLFAFLMVGLLFIFISRRRSKDA